MKLLSTADFAIRLATPYSDTANASSELLVNGNPTGVVVTGEVLEAAVEWQGYRIAFLTDDIPFEDMLRIYMFDADMTLIDTAAMGAMYSTGTFGELGLHPPDQLSFKFFGGIVWRLVLLAEREFALPFLSDPPGVSRQFKFFRLFRVEGKPQPEEHRTKWRRGHAPEQHGNEAPSEIVSVVHAGNSRFKRSASAVAANTPSSFSPSKWL